MSFKGGSPTLHPAKGKNQYGQYLKCLVVCDVPGCQCARLIKYADKAFPGDDALRKYKSALESSNPYNLVILDTVLGGVGYETGKAIRKVEKIRKQKPTNIMVIADDDDPLAAISIFKNLQAVAYLPKPVTKRQLTSTIKKMEIGKVVLSSVEYSILVDALAFDNRTKCIGPMHNDPPFSFMPNN